MSIIKSLQEAYDRRVQKAEEKAKVKLARSQTKADQEKAKLQLQRDNLNLQRELVEERIATQKAKAALKKAKREAGDLTITERAEGVINYFRPPPKKKRR